MTANEEWSALHGRLVDEINKSASGEIKAECSAVQKELGINTPIDLLLAIAKENGSESSSLLIETDRTSESGKLMVYARRKQKPSTP